MSVGNWNGSGVLDTLVITVCMRSALRWQFAVCPARHARFVSFY